MSILVADIGGTHSRLLWQDAQSRHVQASYLNRDYPGLDPILDDFLHQRLPSKHNPTERAILALPAPIHGTHVQLTNLDWQIDAPALQQRYAIPSLHLINDLQAAATAAVALPWASPARQIIHAQHPPADNGPAVVVGLGTGLGIAWLANVADPQAIPADSEGGHIDFAPTTAAQQQLAQALQAQYPHLSYERLLSGPGLSRIDQQLSQHPPRPPESIIQQAQAGEHQALRAIELLIDILAAYLGNIALLFKPRAGIHLCGGLAQALAPWLTAARLHAYANKGRMRPLVESFPVSLILSPQPGLDGALLLAERLPTPPKENPPNP